MDIKFVRDRYDRSEVQAYYQSAGKGWWFFASFHVDIVRDVFGIDAGDFDAGEEIVAILPDGPYPVRADRENTGREE